MIFLEQQQNYGLEQCGVWEPGDKQLSILSEIRQSVSQSVSAAIQVQVVMFVFLSKTNRAIRVFFTDEKHISTINTSKLMNEI